MRVTLGMLTGSAQANIEAASERLLEAQDRASSGKRIRRPSDDVPGTGRAMSLRSAIASIEQFERNSDVVNSQLSVTSGALDTMVSALGVAQVLALSAVNGSRTADASASIVTQLDEIMKQIAGAANTQYVGKYIFAGGLSDTKPIVPGADGSAPYVYQGNSGQFTIQTSPGMYMTANVTGDQVFNMGGVALPGVPDAFSTLESIKDKILAGDSTGVSDAISTLDTIRKHVITIRSQVGARLNRLEASKEALSSSKITAQDLLSKTEDIDLVGAVIELQTRQNVYQAAISVASKIMQTTLADYFK